MKFTTVFAVIATIATAVFAINTSDLELRSFSNADRLAKRLPLKAPVRRGQHTPTYGAPHGKPSGAPSNSCSTGKVQCCNSVTHANPAVQKQVQNLVGVLVDPKVAVAFTCSPIGALGLGAQSCNAQTVCCENNQFNGVVAIGCSPINVNLV